MIPSSVKLILIMFLSTILLTTIGAGMSIRSPSTSQTSNKTSLPSPVVPVVYQNSQPYVDPTGNTANKQPIQITKTIIQAEPIKCPEGLYRDRNGICRINQDASTE